MNQQSWQEPALEQSRAKRGETAFSRCPLPSQGEAGRFCSGRGSTALRLCHHSCCQQSPSAPTHSPQGCTWTEIVSKLSGSLPSCSPTPLAPPSPSHPRPCPPSCSPTPFAPPSPSHPRPCPPSCSPTLLAPPFPSHPRPCPPPIPTAFHILTAITPLEF